MSETNNERSNPYESPTQVQAFQRSGNSLQLNALPLICGVVSTSLGPSVHWTGELMDTNDGFLSMFIASSCFTLLVSLIGFVSGVYGYLKKLKNGRLPDSFFDISSVALPEIRSGCSVISASIPRNQAKSGDANWAGFASSVRTLGQWVDAQYSRPSTS